MILVHLGRWSYGRFKDDNNIFYKMKNDLTTGTWQDDIWCPIIIILLCTSDVICDSAECINLMTVVEDGLVPFERVWVRDSHESYFFHGRNLYEMDHLEVQEEELLLEVEVIRHSSIALKKQMFREQHALMVLGTFFHFLLFRMLILGSSEYLTTQVDRPLHDFVGVMLFERCLDLMTTGLDGVVTPGQLDLLKNIFAGVNLMHNLWIAWKVVRCFGGRYNFPENRLVHAEAHVQSLARSIHDNTMVDLGNAVCTICLDLLSTNLIGIAACGHAYHWVCWSEYHENRRMVGSAYRCPTCRAYKPCFYDAYFLWRSMSVSAISALYIRERVVSKV